MAGMAERLQHQEIVLDMEVHDNCETALMLLEHLWLYPDMSHCAGGFEEVGIEVIKNVIFLNGAIHMPINY
ncbi:hypothetical protein Aduo_016231 [Ancylostoma duodenale]